LGSVHSVDQLMSGQVCAYLSVCRCTTHNGALHVFSFHFNAVLLSKCPSSKAVSHTCRSDGCARSRQ
jgi:hypothetical protein